MNNFLHNLTFFSLSSIAKKFVYRPKFYLKLMKCVYSCAIAMSYSQQTKVCQYYLVSDSKWIVL